MFITQNCFVITGNDEKNDNTLVRISGPIINYAIIYKTIYNKKISINFSRLYDKVKNHKLIYVKYEQTISVKYEWIICVNYKHPISSCAVTEFVQCAGIRSSHCPQDWSSVLGSGAHAVPRIGSSLSSCSALRHSLIIGHIYTYRKYITIITLMQ